MKRLLVTGSRTWDDQVKVVEVLMDAVRHLGGMDRYDPAAPIPIQPGETITLVHGGADGADQIAHQVWYTNQHAVEVHPVKPDDWAEHGKRAGYLRNKHMVDLGADLCVAFIKDGSKGATMTADLAEAAGITTWRVTA